MSTGVYMQWNWAQHHPVNTARAGLNTAFETNNRDCINHKPAQNQLILEKKKCREEKELLEDNQASPAGIFTFNIRVDGVNNGDQWFISTKPELVAVIKVNNQLLLFR